MDLEKKLRDAAQQHGELGHCPYEHTEWCFSLDECLADPDHIRNEHCWLERFGIHDR